MEITITENVTNALIAGTSTTVTLSYVGVQGPPGTVGTAAYATNAGTSVFATTSGTASYATNAGTSVFATTSGTATYATNAGSALTSGTSSYATTSGTATFATTSGTATYATTSGTSVFATTAGTATYATTSGTSVFSTNAGTSVFATNAGTSVFATNAGTATYATNAGTAVNISGTIAATQVTGTAAVLTTGNTFTVGGQVIKTGADATAGLAIWRNSATQTADLLTIYQSNGSSVLAKIAASGALTVGAGGVGANQVVIDPQGSNNIFTWSPATVGNGVSGSIDPYGKLILGGANATTASLNIPSTATSPSSPATGDMWFSSGNVQFQTASGLRTFAYLQAANTFTAGQTITPSSGTAATINAAASAVGVVVKANATTPGNLQEWQSSAGATLAKVDGSGNTFANSLRTNSSYFRADETFSGASIQLKKLTSSALVPGTSDYAKLYFRDGTNTGTLKLVVRAGTAGAETTILDNIPQT